MKEASHKRPPIIGFHLHEMSRIGTSTETKKDGAARGRTGLTGGVGGGRWGVSD